MHTGFHFQLPIHQPVLIFSIVLMIIFFAPILCKRLGIPEIIGLILAGILLGPNGFHVLERDNSIILFGTVGLLYIMFIAALEVDINDFLQQKYKSLLFGVLSFVFPALIGLTIARFALGFSWISATLLGGALATHTLISYPIASRLGITRNDAVTMTVGGTAITDTIVLLLLAVVSGMVQGKASLGFILQLGASILACGAVILWILPLISRWFFRNVESEGAEQYIFVMAIIFLSAFLAQLAGLEPIVGAFLAGLGLNKLIPQSSPLMNRIEFVGNALFIPFFLISVGMMVDPGHLISGWASWGYAAVMLFTTNSGKFLAAWASQKLFGFSRVERNIIFGLSGAQVAATLAVVLVGFDLHLFGEDILNATILLILFSTLTSSFVVDGTGRKLAILESRKVKTQNVTPNRILVPVANPATIESLIDLAVMLRKKSSDEPIFALSIVKDAWNAKDELESKKSMLEKAQKHASASDTEVKSISRIDVNIPGGIIRAIREMGITELIIGWNAKITAKDRIFGSVMDRLLENTSITALVCNLRQSFHSLTRIKVLVPPHGELEPGFPQWMQSLELLAKEAGASVTFFSHGHTLSEIKTFLEKNKSTMKTKYVDFELWDSLISIKHELTTDDLLVVVSARKSSISYFSALDSVPRQISKDLPKVSFIILFPEQYHRN